MSRGVRGDEGGLIDILAPQSYIIVAAGYLASTLKWWMDYDAVYSMLHH